MTVLSCLRLASAGLAVTIVAMPATARDVPAHRIKLTGAWTRPTPPAAAAGAGYLTITNAGSRPDRLLGGTSSAVREVQVHQMMIADGVMRMRPVQGLVIPAGGTVTLSPGGYHLMLIGPNRPFQAGGRIPATLKFERAGAVRVVFDVRMTPPAAAGGGR